MNREVSLKKYQGVFILFPPADEAALETKLTAIRGTITKLGGAVETITRMGRTSFARPLRKKDSGFFVLITFNLPPAQVAALRDQLKLNEDILRVEIILAPPPAAAKPAAAVGAQGSERQPQKGAMP
jgi:small subunit ribosomal protein S6